MSQKTKIQTALSKLTKNHYFSEIPLDEVITIIESNGGMIVDEAGEKWSGFLCGENSQATWKVQGIKGWLTMTWYKMQSGKWEIVAYIS